MSEAQSTMYLTRHCGTFLWCMVSKPLYAAEAFLWKETDKNIHSNNMDEISEKSYQDKKKLPFKAWYIRQEST